MRLIENISELQYHKIYYIEVPPLPLYVNSSIIARPKLKLKGKFLGIKDDKVLFGDLEYVNNHYDHLTFPKAKPLMLYLRIFENKVYRFVCNDISEFQYRNSTPCTLYEPENERILTNYVIRNCIIGDPYFNFYNIT